LPKTAKTVENGQHIRALRCGATLTCVALATVASVGAFHTARDIAGRS